MDESYLYRCIIPKKKIVLYNRKINLNVVITMYKILSKVFRNKIKIK